MDPLPMHDTKGIEVFYAEGEMPDFSDYKADEEGRKKAEARLNHDLARMLSRELADEILDSGVPSIEFTDQTKEFGRKVRRADLRLIAIDEELLEAPPMVESALSRERAESIIEQFRSSEEVEDVRGEIVDALKNENAEDWRYERYKEHMDSCRDQADEMLSHLYFRLREILLRHHVETVVGASENRSAYFTDTPPEVQ